MRAEWRDCELFTIHVVHIAWEIHCCVVIGFTLQACTSVIRTRCTIETTVLTSVGARFVELTIGASWRHYRLIASLSSKRVSLTVGVRLALSAHASFIIADCAEVSAMRTCLLSRIVEGAFIALGLSSLSELALLVVGWAHLVGTFS